MESKTVPDLPELTAHQDRFWSCVEKRGSDDCWPWVGTRFANGYGRFRVPYHTLIASRVAAALTLGDPGSLLVCHRCDNPPCCNPSHLFLGTNQDNMTDMVLKGRSGRGGPTGRRWNGIRRGEGNPCARLNDAAVRAIRQRSSAGERTSSIAASLGVSRSTVRAVETGRTWGHVQ